mmetsp:Transcript_36191/g.90296  ORF Transcript_36191/g.90296 Transcript_36191/m.90296 type:complete len:238 (-) Transcript_36191:1222-1935(-)
MHRLTPTMRDRHRGSISATTPSALRTRRASRSHPPPPRSSPSPHPDPPPPPPTPNPPPRRHLTCCSHSTLTSKMPRSNSSRRTMNRTPTDRSRVLTSRRPTRAATSQVTAVPRLTCCATATCPWRRLWRATVLRAPPGRPPPPHPRARPTPPPSPPSPSAPHPPASATRRATRPSARPTTSANRSSRPTSKRTTKRRRRATRRRVAWVPTHPTSARCRWRAWASLSTRPMVRATARK